MFGVCVESSTGLAAAAAARLILRILAAADTANTGIYNLRTTMWNPVVSRSHNPIAVFPFISSKESGDVELMLHGTVSYTLNDGRKCEDVEWAARGTLVTSADEVKWKSYQVYMVRTLLRMESLSDFQLLTRYSLL